ncbi:hypothetical protein [Burkholderia plantarii]|uniref:hypothetical protein n=1 Tax=Burkholderia plantarii TaxID=41899 RepID=UPI0008709592|nr:hypothetical protein [Burkholderia plantarii]
MAASRGSRFERGDGWSRLIDALSRRFESQARPGAGRDRGERLGSPWFRARGDVTDAANRRAMRHRDGRMPARCPARATAQHDVPA